jgi:hypothetical protein
MCIHIHIMHIECQTDDTFVEALSDLVFETMQMLLEQFLLSFTIYSWTTSLYISRYI